MGLYTSARNLPSGKDVDLARVPIHVLIHVIIQETSVFDTFHL